MKSTWKIYVRVDTRADNVTPDIVLDILKQRHRHFIFEGMVDGYWRGFCEETMAITISDEEEVIAETLQLIKAEVQHEYLHVDDQNQLMIL